MGKVGKIIFTLFALYCVAWSVFLFLGAFGVIFGADELPMGVRASLFFGGILMLITIPYIYYMIKLKKEMTLTRQSLDRIVKTFKDRG
jgi:hypothetical protein